MANLYLNPNRIPSLLPPAATPLFAPPQPDATPFPVYQEPAAPPADFSFLRAPLKGSNWLKTLGTVLGGIALAKDPGQTLGAVAGGLNAYQGTRERRAAAGYERAMHEYRTREDLRRYNEQQRFREQQAALDEAYRQAALGQSADQFNRSLGADLGRFGATEQGFGSPLAQQGLSAALPGYAGAVASLPAGSAPQGAVPAAAGAPAAGAPAAGAPTAAPVPYSEPGSAVAGRILAQQGQSLENQTRAAQLPSVESEARVNVATEPDRISAIQSQAAQARVAVDQAKTALAAAKQDVGESRATFAARKKKLEADVKVAEAQARYLNGQITEQTTRNRFLPLQLGLDAQGKAIGNYGGAVTSGLEPAPLPDGFEPLKPFLPPGVGPLPPVGSVIPPGFRPNPNLPVGGSRALPKGAGADGTEGYPLFPKGTTTVSNRLAALGFEPTVPFDVAQAWFGRWRSKVGPDGLPAFKVRDFATGETAYEIDTESQAGQNALNELQRLNARYTRSGGPAPVDPKTFKVGNNADSLFHGE